MTKKSPPTHLVVVSCALCGRLHSADAVAALGRLGQTAPICSHCGDSARGSLGLPHTEIFVSVQGGDVTGH